MLNKIRKIHLTPAQYITLGFLIIILLGGFVLYLPCSYTESSNPSIIDTIFTAASAVCVTGLVTLDTATTWTFFGQLWILCLIQIGGIGFVTIITTIFISFKKKVSLPSKIIARESLSQDSLGDIINVVKKVVIVTFIIELIGVFLLAIYFIPSYGFLEGLWYSIFHSISAFCNAGFDLMGNFSSITSYATNITILLNTSALIIIGGLGFAVWSELYSFKNLKKLSLHTKIVLLTTFILIVCGMVFIFLFEYNNSKTIGNMSIIDKLTNSFFASVTTRTAGLNSIPLNDMTGASKFLTIIFMFIGGSPGSTAGGIKTSTLAIIVLIIIAIIKGREDTEVYGKRISKDTVQKAILVFMLGIFIVLVVTLILTITEQASLESLIFEAVSAFGTVGLTLGVTPHLSIIGKIVIMITMYLGRVGPMTVMLAITRKKRKRDYRYPEDKILIG